MIRFIKNKQQESYDRGFEDGVNASMLIDLATEGHIRIYELDRGLDDVIHMPFFFRTSYHKGYRDGLDFAS